MGDPYKVLTPNVHEKRSDTSDASTLARAHATRAAARKSYFRPAEPVRVSYDRRRILLAGVAFASAGIAGCADHGGDDGDETAANEDDGPALGKLLAVEEEFSVTGSITVDPDEEGTSIEEVSVRVVGDTLRLEYERDETRIVRYHRKDRGRLVVGDRCRTDPIEAFDPDPRTLDHGLSAVPAVTVDAVDRAPVVPGAFRKRLQDVPDLQPVDRERVDGTDRFVYELPHGGRLQDRVTVVVDADGRPIRIESRRVGEWVMRTWERRVRRVVTVDWRFDDWGETVGRILPDDPACPE